MEQHLKTKVLDDKALSPSAISCQQQIPKFLIPYSYAIPPCKRSYIEEVFICIVNPLLL